MESLRRPPARSPLARRAGPPPIMEYGRPIRKSVHIRARAFAFPFSPLPSPSVKLWRSDERGLRGSLKFRYNGSGAAGSS